ncbi:hypothetical protein BK026_09060 [Alteromonas sp. V450]|uniref:hypothetical protein n=1 Tax=Alteromonas sp. V450 TaxID=1912139 RepID=UPI0008FF2524|nr:hypothetical protein [Alteromonas sp. V450]OJF68930.1 hypothetical protein BK026_09060 [Alteromonas sp. V450]
MKIQSTANRFVQQLLKAVNLPEGNPPQESFNLLRTALTLGPAEHVLKKIINGEQVLRSQGKVFYCNEPSFAHADVVEKALGFLRSEGLTPPDLLLVDISISHQDVGSMTPFCQGKAAYIRISATSEAHLFEVLVHELVHASVLSGHLFLDEAIAYYFENKCIGGTLLSQIKSSKGSALLNWRLLLEYNEKDDPLFDKLMPGSGLLIHAFGAVLIEQLVNKVGISGVVAFYNVVAAQGTKTDLVRKIERLLEEKIEDIEERVGLRAPLEQTNSTSDHQSVLISFVACHQEIIDKAYRRFLLSDVRSDSLCEIQNGIELTVLTSIGVEKATSKTLSRLEFHILQSRFQWYEEHYYGSNGYFMFRGLFNLIKSFTQTNRLEEIFYLEEANADLEMALQRQEAPAFVKAQMAKLSYHRLKHIDASLQPAIRLYEDLRSIPEFSNAVAPVIEQLNELEGERNAA